jgi:hypothetical protein
MTSEELAAARLSLIGEEIPESGSREECEVRSEDKSDGGEDLVDVDADPKELIDAKSEKSYPPAFMFGESKVTANLIREYEVAGFFPVGDARAPLDEQVPTPEADEVVVFQDFFTCGLRFPCDPVLPAILDKFSVKIHQLSPNSFLELPKFFWIMKTFSSLTMVNSMRRITRVVPSTPADRIHERV